MQPVMKSMVHLVADFLVDCFDLRTRHIRKEMIEQRDRVRSQCVSE
jgi:hypothetical protein